MKGKNIVLPVVLVLGMAVVCEAQVKEYPKKPIQIVVGHAAGSAIDVCFRLIADEVSRTWKTPVNTINKPQAGGAVAANEVAHAEKDGYTLFGTHVGGLATLSIANPKSPVHIQRDFDPIEIHTYATSVLYVRADSPFKSLEDVVAGARKKPGELTAGIASIGSNSHLESLLLNRLAKIDITLVHQDGIPEIMTGVLGGHFNLGWGNHVNALPHVTAGRVRALATDASSPLGVATFAEKGYPQIDLAPHMGLMAPKGLPPAIIKAWEDALNTMIKDPKFQAALTKAGFIFNITMGPDKLDKLIKEEVTRYSRFTPAELGWGK
jgi:tripartite-type tricarboxylate transporter receptor subunit TctC